MSKMDFRDKPTGWRTQNTHDAYADSIEAGDYEHGCVLCDAPSVAEFEHWRVIKNKFPYDVVSSRHDMIIPKAHKVETELTESEKIELLNLKKSYLNEHYMFVAESLPQVKSIPQHFHLHLLVIKNPC